MILLLIQLYSFTFILLASFHLLFPQKHRSTCEISDVPIFASFLNFTTTSSSSQIFHSSTIFFTSIVSSFFDLFFFFCPFSFYFLTSSFFSFFFCFYYSDFSCFGLYCFSYSSEHLVIFTCYN